MKIRPRTNIGSLDCEITPLLMEGETRDVPDHIGKHLVERHLADNLDPPTEPAPVVRAIPNPPAIAEAKAPEIKPVETRKYQSKSKPAVLNVQPRKQGD